MDNNINNDLNKNNKKINRPKFNLNWLYMIILMMIVGLYFTNENGAAIKEIPYNEFQQYVKNGYISRVVGYDDNSVEAYIKSQYVANVFRADSSRVGKNPLIITEAPSREALAEFLQKVSVSGFICRAVSVAVAAVWAAASSMSASRKRSCLRKALISR